MAEHQKREITPDDILTLIAHMGVKGEEKFKARHEDFTAWIKDFIRVAKGANLYPAGTRLINGFDEKKTGLYLAFKYFDMVERFVRPHLKETKKEGDVINRYKIAATSEFIIMKNPPFESEWGELPDEILAVNVDFAFFVVLQIIISWEIDKPGFSINLVKDLISHDMNTREFIDEHKKWLMRSVPPAYQSVIFSNMQTIRLLHYWLREPKDGEKFKSHQD